MIPMTLTAIAEVVGGEVVDEPSGAPVTVTGPAFLDSRAPDAGGLFVAVVGERVDGHDYSRLAVDGGAAGVLGSRPTGVPTVVVDDPVAALGRLARHMLDALPDIVVGAPTPPPGHTGPHGQPAAGRGTPRAPHGGSAAPG